MKKNYTTILSIIFFTGIIFWTFYSMMPHINFSENIPMSEFSTNRAIEHIKKIAAAPHYVSSENHKKVAYYLENELKEIGFEVKSEEGFTLLEQGTLVKSHNILARIKGSKNSKCLLLLSHFDSAPHSKSKGASDDAVGVATILEGIRAFVHNNTSHKNDIIILFSDAEELGLNGAAQFVTKNSWAKEVGLVINFEARGTNGPSYMLMEVNQGNANLVATFAKAKTPFPVSNSMLYSIYKMLPNDTDLTIFREKGKIQGFNFAFIDDHFNYHTAQDDIQHLNKNSLAHQGTYLMPLLAFYKDANLKNLNTTEDFVYFNTPINFVSYPFSWNLPLCFIAIGLLIIFIFVGLAKRVLNIVEIIKGLFYFLLSTFLCGVIGYGFWKIILLVYPQYKDILHGFTYNGHYYIIAFLALALAINFWIYRNYSKKPDAINLTIAPIVIWILISIIIAIYLPGAGFFIIPVLFAIISVGHYVLTQKSNLVLNLLLNVPVIVLFAPMLITLPVGLGLKMLFASTLLLSLVIGLMMPVFGQFESKKIFSFVFFASFIGFLVQAHINSGYEYGKAKPNSLLYVQDTEKQKAIFATYDVNLDTWTNAYFAKKNDTGTDISIPLLASKYNSEFTYTVETKFKNIPSPSISFLRDSVAGNSRFLKIMITPNRKVNRYDVFAPEEIVFNNFKANGVSNIAERQKSYKRNSKKLIRYYVVNNEPLVIEFETQKGKFLNMELLESSFDLLENTKLNIKKRPHHMMPTPFVLTDAVVIKQKIKPTSKPKDTLKFDLIK